MRFIPVAALLALALFSLSAPPAESSRYGPADEPVQVEAPTETATEIAPTPGATDGQWTLGLFTVRVQPLPEGEGFGVHILRQGEEVMDSVESWVMEPEISGPMADTPWPGCELLWISTYSGGAHCCYDDILLISCPDRDLVSRLGLGDSQAGDPVTKGRNLVLPVTDWSMAYYGPEGSEDLFLPFAFSPAFARFLIFEPDGLRPDRPGEFPGFHAGQRAEAERAGQDPDYPAMSITAAYHAYMVAKDLTVARAVLVERLPEAWLPHADAVMADIVKAAEGFNPVENLVFPKP